MLEEDRKRRQFEEQKQKLRLLSSVKPKVSFSLFISLFFSNILMLLPLLIIFRSVPRREKRVGMMPWRRSKVTWTALAEMQRCTPLHHHKPRKQVPSPQSSDVDVIPGVCSLFFFLSSRSTLCECAEIFSSLIHISSPTLSL